MSKYNFCKIAEWGIDINDVITEIGRSYWPLQLSPFYNFDEKQSSDFYLSVNTNESIEEPKDILVEDYTCGFYPYSIYRDKNGNYMWFLKDNQLQHKLVYHISNDWKNISILFDNTKTYGLEAFTYLGNIFSYSILNYGGIMFHGVVMEYNNKGIIISADSGVGKTTHTRMWRDEFNALIINGDRSLCRKIDNKWYVFGSPWFGSSGEYINRKVEIKAIVLLQRGINNEVTSLNKIDSALGLIEHAFVPKWDEKMINKSLDYIDDIVNNIPVYKLTCTPDIEAVEVLKKEIDKL